MKEEQKLKIQIGKKEKVIKLNSKREAYEVLKMNADEYRSLSDSDKLEKLSQVIKENSWRGQRKPIELRKTDKITLNNNFEILRNILMNGGEEDKNTILNIINKRVKELEIKQLEEELDKCEKCMEEIKAKIKELRGE